MSGLKSWFKRQERTLEAQSWWGAFEQVLHAILAGVPAFLAIHWLPLDFWPTVAVALVVAGVGQPYGWAWGLAREIRQNWDDPDDETTLFRISRLPVNLDMLFDMAAYLAGGAVASLAATRLVALGTLAAATPLEGLLAAAAVLFGAVFLGAVFGCSRMRRPNLAC